MKINSWLTNKYIAHRGLFNNKDIPENSIAAFEKAVQNKFAIEMDVRIGVVARRLARARFIVQDAAPVLETVNDVVLQEQGQHPKNTGLVQGL